MTVTDSWSPRFDLRTDGIPKERYTSPAFARLEAERLWARAWQMACRLDEIPEPGDFTVYDIVDQSVLVVRQKDGSVKAYFNVCPHRATQLARGTGRFATSRIVCPFHGWAWAWDGTNTHVLDAEEFCGGHPSAERVNLRECHAETWLGNVWVNLACDPVPFDAQFAEARVYLDPLHIDRMRVHWWVRAVLPANWKLAQEAFLEGYHSPGTHPQLPMYAPDGTMSHRSLRYDVYPGGHASFHFDAKNGQTSRRDDLGLDEFIEQLRVLQAGLDAMVLEKDVELARSLREKQIQGGVASAFITALYERAARCGHELPVATPETLIKWGGEFFVFPNYFVLPQFGNALCYRSRPLGFDPDQCVYEMWSLTLPNAGEKRERPVCVDVAPDDDKVLREIPLQDFSNIPRMQRGMHSLGFEASQLAVHQEKSILHVHREIDKYLRG